MRGWDLNFSVGTVEGGVALVGKERTGVRLAMVVCQTSVGCASIPGDGEGDGGRLGACESGHLVVVVEVQRNQFWMCVV